METPEQPQEMEYSAEFVKSIQTEAMFDAHQNVPAQSNDPIYLIAYNSAKNSSNRQG